MHETLSQEVLDEVGFDEIADRLGVMVTDVGARADRLVVRREGSFGLLPNETATALAMVLTELLQNAVEHGYPEESGPAGSIVVEPERIAGRLRVTVDDDGVGLPDGFDLDTSVNLGLSIVRTLVESELGGSAGAAAAGRPTGRAPWSTYRWTVPTERRRGGERQAVRTRARELRRLSARRSSSLSPPQTPWSWPASERPREALLAHVTASAHLLGLLDLEDGRSGVADGEEQLRVLVEAGRAVAPIHGFRRTHFHAGEQHQGARM